jgi:hypothetical protein
MRRDSTVGIATGYGLEDEGVGVRVPVEARIFSSPCLPARFWGPILLVSNRYRELLPRGKSRRGVKLTTHLQLVPRSIQRGSIYPFPQYAFIAQCLIRKPQGQPYLFFYLYPKVHHQSSPLIPILRQINNNSSKR